MRDAPDGAWVATAKVNFEGTAQYHQAGIMVYGDDSNFTKFGRIAHSAATNSEEKFEFIYENNGTARNDAADSTGNIPADFPDDFWVRLTSDGTNVTGAYSTNGTAWTPVGRAAPLPANAQIGLFAFSNDGTGNPIAAFDEFTLTGDNVGGGPSGPSFDDEFDGSTLDAERWDASVRANENAAVAGGQLTITTEPGDIYTERHDAAAEQLHPPGRVARGRELDDRDEDRLEGQRRLRPGWPDRLRGRQQLREARPDRRRRPDPDQPHRAAHGGQRHADRAGHRPADRRRHRRRSSTCA